MGISWNVNCWTSKPAYRVVIMKSLSLIKNKKQTAMINILNLQIFWLRLDVSYARLYMHFQKHFKKWNMKSGLFWATRTTETTYFMRKRIFNLVTFSELGVFWHKYECNLLEKKWKTWKNRFYAVVSHNLLRKITYKIHLIPKWPQFKFSFVYLQISLFA